MRRVSKFLQLGDADDAADADDGGTSSSPASASASAFSASARRVNGMTAGADASQLLSLPAVAHLNGATFRYVKAPYRKLCPPLFTTLHPHFRLYKVVSLHACVVPYKYRKILEMLPTLRHLCSTNGGRYGPSSAPVLCKLDLELSHATLTLVTGPAGCGKVNPSCCPCALCAPVPPLSQKKNPYCG